MYFYLCICFIKYKTAVRIFSKSPFYPKPHFSASPKHGFERLEPQKRFYNILQNSFFFFFFETGFNLRPQKCILGLRFYVDLGLN
jgi:hypothetical protein